MKSTAAQIRHRYIELDKLRWTAAPGMLEFRQESPWQK